MPAIRPEAISNRIRLANEVGTPVAALVAEHGAVNAVLSAIVDELPPHKERVRADRPERDLFARTNEQDLPPSVRVGASAVVAFIERKALTIAVLCQPPHWLHSLPRLPCLRVPRTGRLDQF